MSLSGFQVRQAAAPHIHAVTQRTGLLITHLAVLERNKAPLVSETGLTRHDGNSNPARELVTPDAS
jgi:DNA-binding IclR family transcriptional regulator